MPDTTLPINGATAPEPLTNTKETPEAPTALETIGTRVTCPPDRVPTRGPTPHHIAPAPTGTEPVQQETPFGAEIEEELIIEDFTIDGICGVY